MLEIPQYFLGVLLLECFPQNLNGREIKGILQLLYEGGT